MISQSRQRQDSSAKSIGGVSKHKHRAKTHQRLHRKKKSTKVVCLVEDPIVRGQPFLNSVEKTHIQGTSIITEATMPACQAALMWPFDRVLFLDSVFIFYSPPLITKSVRKCKPCIITVVVCGTTFSSEVFLSDSLNSAVQFGI